MGTLNPWLWWGAAVGIDVLIGVTRGFHLIPVRTYWLGRVIVAFLFVGWGLLDPNWFAVGLWGPMLVFNYRQWRKHKDDDDDNHRGKRLKSWIKNHLPKPIVKVLPSEG